MFNAAVIVMDSSQSLYFFCYLCKKTKQESTRGDVGFSLWLLSVYGGHY